MYSSLDIMSKLYLNLSEVLELRRMGKGVVRLDCAVDEHSVSCALDQLRYVLDSGLKRITLEIMSPGGDVYPAFGLYDVLRGCPVPVDGVVLGYAASAAAMIILQGCTKRWAYPNARFLIHEVRKSGFGVEKTTDAEDDVKELRAIQTRCIEIMAERMRGKPAEVKKLLERREFWMGAQEAKELGIIDGIIRGAP